MANEITSLDPAGTGPPPSVPFAYDDNGNIKSRGDKNYDHDAWNRLVRVYWDDGGGPEITVGQYEYNPRRTLKRAAERYGRSGARLRGAPVRGQARMSPIFRPALFDHAVFPGCRWR
jgi:hypothetical protein